MSSKLMETILLDVNFTGEEETFDTDSHVSMIPARCL